MYEWRMSKITLQYDLDILVIRAVGPLILSNKYYTVDNVISGHLAFADVGIYITG